MREEKDERTNERTQSDVMGLSVVLPNARRLQDTISEVCSATLLA